MVKIGSDATQRDGGAEEGGESPPLEPVGYKRPPVAHRFTKGKSGNSAGRPRGSRSFKTELREVVELRIPVSENGRKTRMSVRQAVLVRLRQQALAGDGRAIDRLLKLVVAHLPDEVVSDDGKRAAEDSLMLAELLADLKSGVAEQGSGNDE